jgi:glycosyltransferase involved in cell wall biosynthesis
MARPVETGRFVFLRPVDFFLIFVQSKGVNIVQITPGAGGMYCGNCLRDNALVSELRRKGHIALMVPLYLPLTLDEPDQSAGVPIFFGGVNVFLDQKSGLYRRAPGWMRRWLDSPVLLRWAAGRAAKTRAEEVGDLTLSMLRGEEGNQARELDELLVWLKSQPERPDVICLSNGLLAGLVRRLKADLGVPVVCMLQGEDAFLDSLPPRYRDLAWQTVGQRLAEADLLLAPSHYYAERMAARLSLSTEEIGVVHNGIDLKGYDGAESPELRPENVAAPLGKDGQPVLGYFARMCPEKGLGILVEAFLAMKRRARVPGLKLRVGGSCGPSDEPFVDRLRQQLRRAGCLDDAEFHPNLDRAGKIAFYRSLSVLSVPTPTGEAFGFYVIEAMAAGVPVVQPRHGAFTELIESTGGGLLTELTPSALAQAIEELLLDPERLRSLGKAAREAVRREFTVERMAEKMVKALGEVMAAK